MRSVSQAKAPLPTPSMSRPSQSACAWTTSPAKTRMSCSGNWHTEVTSFTRLVCGRDFHRHLQRGGDQQQVLQMMFRQAHAAIAQLLRMQRLLDDVLVEALAAQGRVQHVARKEVDEIHGRFSCLDLPRTVAEPSTFEKRIIFAIMFEIVEFRA